MFYKCSTLKEENDVLTKENNMLKIEILVLEKNAQDSSFHNLKAENNKLQIQLETLKDDLVKFVQGRKNLDKLLSKQRCAFNFASLGYNEQRNNKFCMNMFIKPESPTSSIKCYNCKRK